VSLAHPRVHALKKDQEKLIEVALAKVKVLLMVKNAHVVKLQSLPESRSGIFPMPVFCLHYPEKHTQQCRYKGL